MPKIVADSSCDKIHLENANFSAAAMVICAEDKTYVDDETLNLTQMLDHLASLKEKTSTACPGPDAWMQAFDNEEIVYIATITSALSGTYRSAIVAKDLYLQTHPNAQIEIFDSRSTGPHLLLHVEKLAELVNEGKGFEDVCAEMDAYMPHTRLICSLSSLHNMAMNGRVNKVLAKAVGILGLRIIITASEEGTLEPIEKARGDKKAVEAMFQQMVKAGYCGGKVRINHNENPQTAQALADKIKFFWDDVDIQVYPAGGLCSYYAERGSVMMGFETK